MKKHFKILSISLIATFLLSSPATSTVQYHIPANNILLPVKAIFFTNPFSYTWHAHSNAQSYTLELTNTSSQEVSSWQTSQLSITVFDLSAGTYDLKVTAHLTNQSDIIIVEDIIQH